MTDENDKTILKKIRARYGEHLDGSPKITHLFVVDASPFGRPHADWHDEAFRRVDDLRECDNLSTEDAAEQVAPDYIEKGSIEDISTFLRTYWRYRNRNAQADFVLALANEDEEGAIDAYKRMSKPLRKKRGLD